jgi:hypothetical protein
MSIANTLAVSGNAALVEQLQKQAQSSAQNAVAKADSDPLRGAPVAPPDNSPGGFVLDTYA